MRKNSEDIYKSFAKIAADVNNEEDMMAEYEGNYDDYDDGEYEDARLGHPTSDLTFEHLNRAIKIDLEGLRSYVYEDIQRSIDEAFKKLNIDNNLYLRGSITDYLLACFENDFSKRKLAKDKILKSIEIYNSRG